VAGRSERIAVSLVYWSLRRLLELLVLRGRSEREKEIEILLLRHQLRVLERQVARPQLIQADRAVLAGLSRVLVGCINSVASDLQANYECFGNCRAGRAWRRFAADEEHNQSGRRRSAGDSCEIFHVPDRRKRAPSALATGLALAMSKLRVERQAGSADLARSGGRARRDGDRLGLRAGRQPHAWNGHCLASRRGLSGANKIALQIRHN
jgi:hypothetical protein